jgi:hypothetical protein
MNATSLDELMDERHEAFQRALATGFAKFVGEWREANRRYVAAQDTARPGISDWVEHAAD